MKHVLLTIGLLFNLWSFAQSDTDQQLASHYYQEGDYEKAAVYYEKLYDDEPNKTYYHYYYTCLVNLKDFKTAEKLVKKHMRYYPTDLEIRVDMGALYELQGETNKAEQEYEKAIKDLPGELQRITTLANAFRDKEKYAYALETYDKGEKLLKNTYPFHLYKAEIFSVQGRNEEMINEYIELLDFNAGYLNSVKNSLVRIIDFQENDPRGDILKVALLKKLQKDPENAVYSEMLIWYFEQKNDFYSAFIQVKAIDKRTDMEGERLIRFAQICLSNERFDLATKSYQAIVTEYGKEGYYYYQAKSGLLISMYQKITKHADYNYDDLKTLEKNYLETLDEMGRSERTVSIMKDLAHIQAFYLHDTESAAKVLHEVLQMPRVSRQIEAEVKLELGDILLFQNNIWDASLYYAQVDKAFKHDAIGHEAKFRNAKIFYYSGDFELAKAQLDVLKTSTSKLIANDAMEISLLIGDNLNMDTTVHSLQLYSAADLYAYQNKFEEAEANLKEINQLYPNHSLNDEILYLRSKIERKKGNFDQAIVYLQEIVDKHHEDILADNALNELAYIYDYVLKDEEKAKEYYKQLMFDFPGSLFVVEARKRFRELRGDKDANKEVFDEQFNQ